MPNDEEKVRCPKCNSDQITANKKGFGIGKAIGGALLTGGIGLLAGGIGSGKIIITCLNCGNKFKPGQGKKPEPAPVVVTTQKLSIEDAKELYQTKTIAREQLTNPPSKAQAEGSSNVNCLAVLIVIIILVLIFSINK